MKRMYYVCTISCLITLLFWKAEISLEVLTATRVPHLPYFLVERLHATVSDLLGQNHARAVPDPPELPPLRTAAESSNATEKLVSF